MNKCGKRVAQILMLGCMCSCSHNIFTMHQFLRTHDSQIKYCTITAGATLVSSLIFSHVIFPVISGHRKQLEIERRAKEHAQEQVRLRNAYHDIEGKYKASDLPIDLKSLQEYKRALSADKAELNTIMSFAWDNPVEKEVVVKLARNLVDLDNQVERLIISRTVQEFKHDIEGKYNSATIPSDIRLLQNYKRTLLADKAELNKIMPVAAANSVEKEVMVKLARHLEGFESHVERLIISCNVQDIKKEYKRELELLKASNAILDFSKMNKIVFEKYGHVPYKFCAYKADLSQRLAQCKNIGASNEDIDDLDLLDKLTNNLFSQSLDNERVAREKALKEQRLFDAEIDSKVAVKDFYKEAERHVANASRTVEHFAKEMDAQCKQQMSAIEKCSLLLNSFTGLMSNWGVRIDQQTERLVYEMRQEGRTTRDAVHTEGQAIRTHVNQVGNKVDSVGERINAARQQAAQAQQQAALAQRQAAQAQQQAVQAQQQANQLHVLPTAPALPVNYPGPSAPPLPTNDPVPSAPPLEEGMQNQAQGECPVCLETKPLISFGDCRHEICPHCKELVRKSNNNTCPLCRGPLGGDNFPLRK